MNAEAMLLREETEQRVIEAKIRERAQAEQRNNNNHQFGASLQNDERVATLRARSSSMSDHPDEFDAIPEDVLRESFAMTPEERRMLEDEMRAQHSHPLSLRLEAEAEERRLRNEQEFLRQNPAQALQLQAARARSARRSGRGAGERRNWNQIVEAFERGGHGEVNTLDDLVVLEAAMILSMEEESRRRAGENNGNNNNNNNDGGAFDAYRHAEDGFPLVRSILSGRQDGDQNEQLQALANNLYRRRSRNSILRAYGGASANGLVGLDGTGFLGLSEEDQIAMAIAASMQDQQQQDSGESASGDGGDTSNVASEENSAAAASAGEEENAASATVDSGASAENTDEEERDEDQVEAQAGEATAEPAGTETQEAAAPVQETASADVDLDDAEEAVEQARPLRAQSAGTDNLDLESHGGDNA
jgi:hypothetical protein